MKESQFLQKINKYLSLLVSQDGSDLYLSAGNYPIIRIDNILQPLMKEEVIDHSEMMNVAKTVLNSEQLKKLEKEKQVDFSWDFENDVRFRANMFFQKGSLSLVLRVIPGRIKTLKELNLPENLYEFTQKKQGLFLVVGPNGHGKSTTLASLIDYINKRERKHIVTIEDPIEYIHKSNKSLVEQREVYQDTAGFHEALKACFREAVDIILVGEMRDLETISTAITAAETGHLIFATLHTNDAIQTVDRIIDIFPPYQQKQIRFQLANVLVGVVSQRLLRRVGGGRIPAVEILKKNTAVENLIRQNQTHQITTVLETSLDEGMISIDRSLAQLVQEGSVTLEEAKGYASDTNSLNLMLKTNR